MLKNQKKTKKVRKIKKKLKKIWKLPIILDNCSATAWQLMYFLQKSIQTSKQFILIGHQLNSGWFFPTDTAKKVTFKICSSLESDFRKLCSLNPNWHEAGHFYPPCNFGIEFCQLHLYQKFPNVFWGENWHQLD